MVPLNDRVNHGDADQSSGPAGCRHAYGSKADSRFEQVDRARTYIFDGLWPRLDRHAQSRSRCIRPVGFTVKQHLFQRKEGTPMRMKTIKALGTVARAIQRVLEVRLPMRSLYGLRTR
jgi:hypothetical protein